jgi:hypothetical protein
MYTFCQTDKSLSKIKAEKEISKEEQYFLLHIFKNNCIAKTYHKEKLTVVRICEKSLSISSISICTYICFTVRYMTNSR